MKLFSVTEAAAALSVTRRRVLALITEGRLPAQRIGQQWAIREKDLADYQPLPPHRPKKACQDGSL
jgi:excisionase family DNA binding protein